MRRCASATREAAGLAGDIDNGVRRLDAAVGDAVTQMYEIRVGSEAATGQAVEALTRVRDRVASGADEVHRLSACGIAPGELREVYDDDYYDPVAEGVYDAFVIDLPIVDWCATDSSSPWFGRIETVGDPITQWIYCAAVRDDPSAATLLEAVDEQLGRLKHTSSYRVIVERWQGRVYDWGKTSTDFL